MKVHRIVLLVVDHDGIGVGEARKVIETARYPNHCISPRVMETATREVEWSDDHPLNGSETERAAFKALFAKAGAA